MPLTYVQRILTGVNMAWEKKKKRLPDKLPRIRHCRMQRDAIRDWFSATSET